MKLCKRNAYGVNVCLERKKLSKKMREIKKMIFKNRRRKKNANSKRKNKTNTQRYIKERKRTNVEILKLICDDLAKVCKNVYL